MKRSPMPPRSTPIQRRTPLRANAPMKRSTKLISPVSERRRSERPQREECRRIVLERDRTCRYPGCQFPATECHELQRGQKRRSTYLDPTKCIGFCGFGQASHHQWVTEHPVEAHALGLAYESWEEVPPQ